MSTKLLQNTYDIVYLTLGMLLDYTSTNFKKNQFFVRRYSADISLQENANKLHFYRL